MLAKPKCQRGTTLCSYDYRGVTRPTQERMGCLVMVLKGRGGAMKQTVTVRQRSLKDYPDEPRRRAKSTPPLRAHFGRKHAKRFGMARP